MHTPALALAFLHDWLNYPLIPLGDGSAFTVWSLVKFVAWIVLLVVMNMVIQRVLVRRLLTRMHFDAGLQFAIGKIVSYTFLGLGFYVALTVNGVNLSSLAVMAGALGIGLGFGLQNIVANWVSGLVLLAERPVAVGDRIEVAGVTGRVTRINLRATTVVTNDNIAVIVPNLDLTSHSVTNWSYGDPRVRLRIPFGVAYGTDLKALNAAMMAVAASHGEVLTDPPPHLYFESFGDSSLNFELAVWTRSLAQSPRRLRSEINYAIERKLHESGIEVPFPQRVVHLRHPDGDPGKVDRTAPSDSANGTPERL